MESTAYTCAAIAGLIHVYIFYLESVAWRQPKSHRLFGVKSLDDVETLAAVMFNQGFYNLFLALGALGGALLGFRNSSVGETLTLYVMAFMLGAALVLLGSNTRMLRAALIQGLLPAIAFVLLLIA